MHHLFDPDRTAENGTHSSYCTIFEAIRQDIIHVKPKIIGINGIDTSGKTQFVIDLSAYLEASGHRVQTLHLDDFYNPLALRRKGRGERQAYIDNTFNLEGLCRHILRPAKRGERVDRMLTLLDLDRDTYSIQKTFHIDAHTLVVLEGGFLYREPIVPYIDYKVFIDIDLETMLARAAARDVPRYGPEVLKKYTDKYIPIQTWYLEAYRPREIADMVIDNRDFAVPKVVARRCPAHIFHIFSLVNYLLGGIIKTTLRDREEETDHEHRQYNSHTGRRAFHHSSHRIQTKIGYRRSRP